MGSIFSVLSYALSSEEDEQSYVSKEVYETGLLKSDTKTTPVVSCSSASTSTPNNEAARLELHSHRLDLHSHESEMLHKLVSVANLAHDRAEKLGRSDVVRDLWNQAERRGANNIMSYKKLTEGLQRVTEMNEDEAKFLFVPLG